MLASSFKRKVGRDARGDMLYKFSKHPGGADEFEMRPEGNVWASFGSVFQGDRAGVEIATSAHEHWLQRYGLLDDKSRLIASRCLGSPSHLQGLVIDDYFSAIVLRMLPPRMKIVWQRNAMRSARQLTEMQIFLVLRRRMLRATEGKLVGACVNPSSRARELGLCTVGSPAMKRVGLSLTTWTRMIQNSSLCHDR